LTLEPHSELHHGTANLLITGPSQGIEASQGLDAGSIPIAPPSCYKFEMSKTVEQWLLFKYVGRELTPLSKPFKTKKEAEKEREKYPERLRKKIGLGVIRIKR
jgi:hypothetical protein